MDIVFASLDAPGHNELLRHAHDNLVQMVWTEPYCRNRWARTRGALADDAPASGGLATLLEDCALLLCSVMKGRPIRAVWHCNVQTLGSSLFSLSSGRKK